MARQSGPSTTELDDDWGGKVTVGKIKNNFDKEFLPADKIEIYTTSDIIRDVLGKEYKSKSQIRKLEEYIRTRPAKLSFLILVSIYRVPWMKSLADPKSKFGDVDLPTLDIVNDCLVVRRGQKDVKISFGDGNLSLGKDLNDMRLFNHERWSFLAPVFTTAKFYQELDDRVPLPFMNVPDTTTRNGSFGTVRKVELHHAHQSDIIRASGSLQNPRGLRITTRLLTDNTE
ncbi:hypothetical protein ACHAPO_011316 [Fusarium lateritium]